MKPYLTVLISTHAVIDINDKIPLSKQKGYHLASFHSEAELNPFTYLKTDDPVSINRIHVDKRTSTPAVNSNNWAVSSGFPTKQRCNLNF